MIMVQESDINQHKHLSQFYQIGLDVRQRNTDFELPWSENQDIEEFINSNEVAFKLFTIENELGKGRVAAFLFADTPDKGYLGWYECDSELNLSKALLSASATWLKKLGAELLQGPMNGSSWSSFRFNTVSSKPLFVTEPYQPLYYIEQWKEFGFIEGIIHETHLVPREISRPMRSLKVKIFSALKGVRFSTYPKNMIQDEDKLHEMHAFFHECFKDNPLYRPVSFSTYKEISAKLEKVIDFKHSYLMTDKKGKPASVLLSYKDVYHQLFLDGVLKDEVHNRKTLYMKTIATAKAWRGKHLSRVLVNFGFVEALRNGYDEVVFGTMMADNKSAQYSKSYFEAAPLRSYVFMQKEL